MTLNLTCPECKNSLDLSAYTDLKEDQIIECETCGISLIVEKIEGDTVIAQIVDEGK